MGWDIHRAIVDNVFENTDDEAHLANRLPGYMDRLMEKGVLGNKTGRGFFYRDDEKKQHVLDPASGDYRPVSEITLPDLSYIDDVSRLYSEGRSMASLTPFMILEECAVMMHVLRRALGLPELSEKFQKTRY